MYSLANIKSAKKRILVNQTKAARNKAIRSAVKTSIKKVDAAVAANDKAAANAALTDAISTISKAASKGVYHKNNAARKVSRLSKAVNSIEHKNSRPYRHVAGSFLSGFYQELYLMIRSSTLITSVSRPVFTASSVSTQSSTAFFSASRSYFLAIGR